MADDYKEKRRQEWEAKQKELFEGMLKTKDTIKDVNIQDNIFLSKTENSYRVKANDNFYFYIPKSALPADLTYNQINGAKITDLKLEKSENGDYLVMKEGKITGKDGNEIKFEFKGEDRADNKTENKDGQDPKKKNKFGDNVKDKLNGKGNVNSAGQRVGKNAVGLLTGDASPEKQMQVYSDCFMAVAPHALKGGTMLAKAFIAALSKKTQSPATAAGPTNKTKLKN